MTISVAMCTYNGSRYLEQQLRSIAEQTRQPSEIIICDDGSTDGTEQVISAFRNSVGFPVHFRRNPINLGSTKNFEQAIRLCRGDFIALCDQDDVWFPEKLQRMGTALEARPEIGGVFSDARLIDESGVFLPKTLWQMMRFTRDRQKRLSNRTQAPYVLIKDDAVTGATLMIRRSLVSLILPISVDWIHDGWISMILTAISEMLPLPECLMGYRLHTTQQVGIGVIPLHKRLFAQKEKALASHRYQVRRYTAIAEKLKDLPGHDKLIAELLRKARFYDERITILCQPRTARVLPLLWSLPDHTRYVMSLVSVLRDLAH